MRKIAIVAIGLAVVVAGLAAAGFRLQRGGNGWPTFVARSNDDVLEADRALQRETRPASSQAAAPAFAQSTDRSGAAGSAFAHRYRGRHRRT